MQDYLLTLTCHLGQDKLKIQDNSLSEVAQKNRENHFARRTQEARIQHTLTWKTIQDTRNNQDKTSHIEEVWNTQTRCGKAKSRHKVREGTTIPTAQFFVGSGVGRVGVVDLPLSLWKEVPEEIVEKVPEEIM